MKIRRWWQLQKVARCAGHGHRLEFGHPLVADGWLHTERVCGPGQVWEPSR